MYICIYIRIGSNDKMKVLKAVILPKCHIFLNSLKTKMYLLHKQK